MTSPDYLLFCVFFIYVYSCTCCDENYPPAPVFLGADQYNNEKQLKIVIHATNLPTEAVAVIVRTKRISEPQKKPKEKIYPVTSSDYKIPMLKLGKEDYWMTANLVTKNGYCTPQNVIYVEKLGIVETPRAYWTTVASEWGHTCSKEHCMILLDWQNTCILDKENEEADIPEVTTSSPAPILQTPGRKLRYGCYADKKDIQIQWYQIFDGRTVSSPIVNSYLYDFRLTVEEFDNNTKIECDSIPSQHGAKRTLVPIEVAAPNLPRHTVTYDLPIIYYNESYYDCTNNRSRVATMALVKDNSIYFRHVFKKNDNASVLICIYFDIDHESLLIERKLERIGLIIYREDKPNTGKEVVIEQDKDIQHKDIQGKDIQHKDIKDKDIQHKDMQGKDIQGKDIQHKDMQGKDIQNKDIQHKDMQGKDIQNKDNSTLPVSEKQKSFTYYYIGGSVAAIIILILIISCAVIKCCHKKTKIMKKGIVSSDDTSPKELQYAELELSETSLSYREKLVNEDSPYVEIAHTQVLYADIEIPPPGDDRPLKRTFSEASPYAQISYK